MISQAFSKELRSKTSSISIMQSKTSSNSAIIIICATESQPEIHYKLILLERCLAQTYAASKEEKILSSKSFIIFQRDFMEIFVI